MTLSFIMFVVDMVIAATGATPELSRDRDCFLRVVVIVVVFSSICC